MEEQRIDNCKVPIDERGTKPRPSTCSPGSDRVMVPICIVLVNGPSSAGGGEFACQRSTGSVLFKLG